PDYVAAQLAAFRQWGMGGEFAVYSKGALDITAYDTYRAALQAASQPGTVDTVAPTLVDVSTAVNGTTAGLGGHATDNLAVASVSWRDVETGATGSAAMTARVVAGSAVPGWAWP